MHRKLRSSFVLFRNQGFSFQLKHYNDYDFYFVFRPVNRVVDGILLHSLFFHH